MSLEKIVQKILDDADEKAAALLKDSSLKSDEIAKKVDGEAVILKQKILEETELKARIETQRAYASKNLEIRKDILKKKRELVDKAFHEALKVIANLEDKQYIELLERLIAGQAAAGVEYEIRFYKNDGARLKKDFVDNLNAKRNLKLRLGAYIDREDSGFIIKKDKIIINFSFSKGMETLRDRIQFDVSKILFG